MALPPRVYFTLQEAAVRWDCSLADIAGWASIGRFDIMTAIGPVNVGHAVVAGYVVVSVTDIMQMFRRCGTGPTKSVLRRIRPKDQDEWIMMMDPATGIEVTLADLLIMADDVRRFETEFDLLRRPASNIGSTARYDWDGNVHHSDGADPRRGPSCYTGGVAGRGPGMVRGQQRKRGGARRADDPPQAHTDLEGAAGIVKAGTGSSGQPRHRRVMLTSERPPPHAPASAAAERRWRLHPRLRATGSPLGEHSAAWSASGYGPTACQSSLGTRRH